MKFDKHVLFSPTGQPAKDLADPPKGAGQRADLPDVQVDAGGEGTK